MSTIEKILAGGTALNIKQERKILHKDFSYNSGKVVSDDSDFPNSIPASCLKELQIGDIIYYSSDELTFVDSYIVADIQSSYIVLVTKECYYNPVAWNGGNFTTFAGLYSSSDSNTKYPMLNSGPYEAQSSKFSVSLPISVEYLYSSNSGVEKVDSTFFLLNEVDVFGRAINSGNVYGTFGNTEALPLFKNNVGARVKGIYSNATPVKWWLSNMVSGSTNKVCIVTEEGMPSTASISDELYYPLGIFCSIE
jgi:hypothetical protein